jgi:hypothetical protein
MKRNACFGLLVLVLVTGFFVMGCDTPTSEETDRWTDVTSLDQLDGTWKGSSGKTMTVREVLEKEGVWNDQMAEMLGNMQVTMDFEITITINANAKTQAFNLKLTQAYSGGNIDTVWASYIKPGLGSQSGITVNDANHSMTLTQNQPATAISAADMAELLDSGLQINEKGSKINLPLDVAISEEFAELLFAELILTKQ